MVFLWHANDYEMEKENIIISIFSWFLLPAFLILLSRYIHIFPSFFLFSDTDRVHLPPLVLLTVLKKRGSWIPHYATIYCLVHRTTQEGNFELLLPPSWIWGKFQDGLEAYFEEFHLRIVHQLRKPWLEEITFLYLHNCV